MDNQAWTKLHKHYKDQDWINKPNIFAQEVIHYFPKNANILELGAGQGQDTRFFAENGHKVESTDVSEDALKLNKEKLPTELKRLVNLSRLDMTDKFPYEDDSFDVVYAHLSIHYFDLHTTSKIIGEIYRVLKPSGIVAVLNNSTNDPEYKQGEELEEGYFVIEDKNKRFFSVEDTRSFFVRFDTVLLDNFGETYKDSAKDIHNLIRFVGQKSEYLATHKFAIPFVGAMIERENANGELEVLMQTRWKPYFDAIYSGTLEFAAGALDQGYEEIHKTLEKEIKEETGLELLEIIDDSRTKVYKPQGNDASFGFRPFCCVQQLENGRPWIGFIFRCRVKDGEPKAQKEEVRDVKWMKVSEIKEIFEKTPEKLFTLEVPAWEYYFSEVV